MHRARLKTALIALIRDLTVSSDFVYGYTFRDGALWSREVFVCARRCVICISLYIWIPRSVCWVQSLTYYAGSETIVRPKYGCVPPTTHRLMIENRLFSGWFSKYYICLLQTWIHSSGQKWYPTLIFLKMHWKCYILNVSGMYTEAQRRMYRHTPSKN